MSTLLRGAFGAAALLLCAESRPALSHATLAVTEAAPNTTYRGVIRIGHGCSGSATRSVTVRIPEGVVAAKPMPKPGWTLAVERGPYARSYDYFGKPLAEGARSITWSGNALPDEHYDEFVFVGRITDAIPAGSALAFPIVQLCEAGAHHWTGAPGPDGIVEPAPSVRILAAAARPGSAPGAAGSGAGPIKVEGPWLRATPGGAKVAGGYLRITNTGPVADRLLSVSVPVAERGEVHETVRSGGVATMRELAHGLAVEPGQTVELAPGGLHLMLLELRAPLKEGESVSGSLNFEKAGPVPVTFAVGGVGAREAPAGAHAHH